MNIFEFLKSKKKTIPDLIKICKVLVEKEEVLNMHPSIEKLAFEAIKFNVDKISSVIIIKLLSNE